MSDYTDIINLPHHVSEHHVSMPVSNRAVQFAPFSALEGFQARIDLINSLVDSGEFVYDTRDSARMRGRTPECEECEISPEECI